MTNETELKNAKLVEYEDIGVLEGIEYPENTDSIRVWYQDGDVIKLKWVGVLFPRNGIDALRTWDVVGVEFFDATVTSIKQIGQCAITSESQTTSGSISILDLFDSLEKLETVMTAAEAVTTYNLSEAAVRNACSRGSIPARKSGETWLILRSDAEARWGHRDEPRIKPSRLVTDALRPLMGGTFNDLVKEAEALGIKTQYYQDVFSSHLDYGDFNAGIRLDTKFRLAVEIARIKVVGLSESEFAEVIAGLSISSFA